MMCYFFDSGVLEDEIFGVKYKSDEWHWVTSCEKDCSTFGAGIRMRILYEDGLPENWECQISGRCEFMYIDEARELYTKKNIAPPNALIRITPISNI